MAERLRVLVVDDEPSVGMAIKSVLKFCGYDAELAGSCASALRRICAAPTEFALVVTDHNMPGACGLDLVRSLRQCCFGGKIIVLSAFLSQDVEEEYSALGVDKIVGKPFDLAALREAVNRLLRPELCPA